MVRSMSGCSTHGKTAAHIISSTRYSIGCTAPTAAQARPSRFEIEGFRTSP
jgi:hypothetical protein